ncbi:MAG: hypothetical protein J6D27_06780 [Ruminiclostridium sp.]|nr:hypothetical protein [Ruminiclostridium sp.]
MKKQKKWKAVIVTSADYNSDGYYLIRIPVHSFETPLCEDEKATVYGMAVKETLQDVVQKRGRITLIYYLLKPRYTELMLYAKHKETVKDRNAGNKTVQSFMNIFKRRTEEKAQTRLWQESYFCHRIKRGKELSDILAQL